MRHMKFNVNVIIIPIVTVGVAFLGSQFTQMGMDWYDNELLPPLIEVPKWLFAVAWNIIYLCCTISALILWNLKLPKRDFRLIAVTFIINAILNVLWTYFFFVLHWLEFSLVEMLLLEATTLFGIIAFWKHSKVASLLLLPYLAWVGFATVLTYQIVQSNT